MHQRTPALPSPHTTPHRAHPRMVPAALAVLLLAALPLLAPQGTLAAQVQAEEETELAHGLEVAELQVEPGELQVRVGETVPISVRALDADGNTLSPRYLIRSSRGIGMTEEGLQGREVGDHQLLIIVALPPGSDAEPATITVPVEVLWPAVERIEVEPAAGALYTGTDQRLRAIAVHADGSRRPAASFRWSTSDPDIARVDDHGHVAVEGEGPVTLVAEFEGVRGELEVDARPLPATRIEVETSHTHVKAGDVVTLDARALDEAGAPVADAPLEWTYTYVPDDSIVAPGAVASIRDDRFVARFPGEYTVRARAGGVSGWQTIRVDSRDVVRSIETLGQGRMDHRRTSDFWVFEGVDGRDYALTGTWGSGGWTYVWDVTDPTAIVMTDSIQVDARTVNDVKVSPDARYATLTLEGASDRRNGVVILDMANPAHPEIATEYDEGLTGGVHNAFPMDDYLYVLSAGERYLIVDMADLRNPVTVGEVDIPGSRIHDVWVHDGIAYSAEWQTGVVMTDVGNGRWGGSPENPVVVNTLALPGGNTHAVFPYYQEETGRFYIFAGDEIIGRSGFALEGGNNRAPYDPDVPGTGTPRNTAGYIHILDYTDPENPKKVARYHVPEYGTHNIWVEDDILYQAYYEGGLRVVDVSGELAGNLYEQGREIAVFKPNDPVGYVANAPTTWSAMPFKGNIFLSDANSGLWAVQLEPETRVVP
ncbi:MAG: hypothetical protein EA352_07515 [Gemmatimonadales bacterium]|nr:MAG: hypothetical protein EA352_07515 [Gemmatimonadales bacterium]